MASFWFTRRAVVLHVVVLVVVPTFAALCVWQVHRALGGNTLSWAYVFEWPFFAGYAVYLWWRLVHEQPSGQEITGRRAGTSPEGTDPAASAARTDRNVDDEELAAYNRYLSELGSSGRRKHW